MDESIQRANGSGAHIRHAAPGMHVDGCAAERTAVAHTSDTLHRHAPEIQMGGRVQEFQHRTIAHHRDVHDPHAPLHRPQRL